MCVRKVLPGPVWCGVRCEGWCDVVVSGRTSRRLVAFSFLHILRTDVHKQSHHLCCHLQQHLFTRFLSFSPFILSCLLLPFCFLSLLLLLLLFLLVFATVAVVAAPVAAAVAAIPREGEGEEAVEVCVVNVV